MIERTIKRRTPSGNKSTFGHWRDYAKERDVWMILMRCAFPVKHPPTHRVRVHIISYRVRLCDRINGANGAKPILDSLVRLGYLFDDSEEWLDDTYDQVKCPRVEERTVIRVENP